MENNVANNVTNTTANEVKKETSNNLKELILDYLFHDNYYNVCLNIKELFNNTYIDLKISEDVIGSISTEKDYITSFKFIIEDHEQMNIIKFHINIEKLDDDYTITIPKVPRNKRITTDKNIFLQ